MCAGSVDAESSVCAEIGFLRRVKALGEIEEQYLTCIFGGEVQDAGAGECDGIARGQCRVADAHGAGRNVEVAGPVRFDADINVCASVKFRDGQ